MRNITKKIKEAIAINALWSVSDFFYFLEMLKDGGFEISLWKDEEDWAAVSFDGIPTGYIWQKYPFVYVKADYAREMKKFINDLKYIVFVETKDLTAEEFTIDMDDDLTNRISYAVNTKGFSANDFWFHTAN
jgi:hypothetical protein